MDAKALTPRDLFDGKVIYEIPSFQRPYVWTEEDQWQPLWDDVERIAEALLSASSPSNDGVAVAGHFLGAVVLKHLDAPAGDPARWSVIDGQQRLTTLQLLLDAAHLAVEELGHEDDADTLLELVENPSKRFRGTEKRFKLWPSRIDRSAFEEVMDSTLADLVDYEESRIGQAHLFFRESVRRWALNAGSADHATRLSALTQVLERYLQIVAITLGANDDDQLIFETLNDRGTPLLAADLIKNFVFDRCERIGVDLESWAEQYWQDFDGEWWREQVSQGRLYRSRIDIFLQYWLTMRTRSEIPTDRVFSAFREFATDQLAAANTAQVFLRGLRTDADTFRDLASLDPSSTEGGFYTRVVEALELGALVPLLLWIISDNHEPPPLQISKALKAVESWAVRRTLLRRTMRDVNKMVVSLLQHLANHSLDRVGDETIAFLRSQDSDAREWPTDEHVIQELPGIKVYGNIKQRRLRTVLGAIEMKLRTARHEEVSLPSRLEVEHVMPKAWRVHWSDGVAADPELSTQRDKLVNSIGNLTLVTKKLNGTLSNRPWTDAEAARVVSSGPEAGLGKRALLGRYSVLVLNKDVVDSHPDTWTDQDIRKRGDQLARMVTEVWPR